MHSFSINSNSKTALRKLLSVAAIFASLNVSAQKSTENYVRYANPLIGTAKMGHTYPGATVPFWHGSAKPRYRHTALWRKG
jgi:hypothetical protein